MKIIKAELRILAPGRRTGERFRGNPVVCRIFTDEGFFGDGEATILTGVGVRAALEMMKDLSEMILGMDPLDTETIWNKLYGANSISRKGGPLFFAPLSAIDIALWDIKGKYFGVPVYKLLGGKQRDKVRCYASMVNVGWGAYPSEGHTPEQYAQRALAAQQEGYIAMKVDFMMHDLDGKPLHKEERTGHASPAILDMAEARLAAVREAVGPNVELMVEGHSGTDAAVALQFGQRMAKYNIMFYEEPSTVELPVCKHVANALSVPIAGGEHLFTRADFYPYMQSGAYQYFQPDIGRCGGITEIKKIIDLADMLELPVMLHCSFGPIAQAAVLQVEAAMNHFVYHEQTKIANNPTTRKLALYDCYPEQGYITIPDVPGIGNTLREEALEDCLCCYVVE